MRQGGTPIAPQGMAQLLERAGFTDVDVHVEPEWQLPVLCVAGRRP